MRMDPNDARTRRPSRRDFLGVAAGGALAAAGLPWLAGCTGRTAGTTTGQAAHLPTYVPFSGPRPDLPSSADGLEAGYFSYPRSLVRSVRETPGRGGEVSVLTLTYNPPPTPMEQNPAWQEVNRRLGVTVRFSIVGVNDYGPKLSTVVAGNDLPDLIYTAGGTMVPAHFLEFLHAKCADLTPHLAGDAVKEYPNLANIPPASWKTAARLADALYGVPIPRPVFGSVLFVRQDLLDQVGISSPRNADDFTRLMKQLTRPQAGQWGMALTGSYYHPFFQEIFRVPDVWRLESSGKLTHYSETEEYRAALAYIRQLQEAGVFYPGSGTAGFSSTQRKTAFLSGRVATVGDGFSAYSPYWIQTLQSIPNARVRALVPFGHDGGRAIFPLGDASLSPTVLKKASPDRIRELLRVLNFLAAPFGTEEYSLIKFGLKDVHYTLDPAGNPVATPRGATDVVSVPWGYVADGPTVIYNRNASDPKEYVRVVHQQEEQLLPLGLRNPVVSLYSATYTSRNAMLEQLLQDRQNDIIAGRSPLSAYDDMVREWRAQGGDQMRTEYQKALELANP
jgi:putative aldouronate transport system substrate-binding protein